MAGAAFLALFGVWLLTQATAGRLGARLLSYREIRPGEVPSPAPASSDPRTPGPSSSTPGTTIAGATHAYAWPAHGTISSGFRPPNRPNHEGIDIAVPTGTPVTAITAGTVILARWNDGFGNQVQVDVGGGRVFSVAHLSEIRVRQGDQVTGGQLLGLSGNTGNSTGPHVHLEIRDNGVPIDPAPLIGATR